MVIFGGDRHHMPFNDFFVLDLASELERQSFNMVINKDSQSDMNIVEEPSAQPEEAEAAAAQ